MFQTKKSDKRNLDFLQKVKFSICIQVFRLFNAFVKGIPLVPLSEPCSDTSLKEHLKNPVLVTENEAPLRSR